MAIRVVRLGTARDPKEGLRIGTASCHRSVLRALLVEQGAAMAAEPGSPKGAA